MAFILPQFPWSKDAPIYLSTQGANNLYLTVGVNSSDPLFMGPKKNATQWYSQPSKGGNLIRSVSPENGMIYIAGGLIYVIISGTDFQGATTFTNENGQLNFQIPGSIGTLFGNSTGLVHADILNSSSGKMPPYNTPESKWISDEQMINCCTFDQSGIPDDKNPCYPDYVTDGTHGYCPTIMLNACQDWSTDKCKNYIEIIKNTPLAKDLVPQIVKNYITNPTRVPQDYCSSNLPYHPCPAGRDDSKDPFFTDVMPYLCGATNSCDKILDQYCSQFLKEDLIKDPTLQTLCGCHLSTSLNPPLDQGLKLTDTIVRPNQYRYPDLTINCDPYCSVKNTIHRSDQDTCKSSTCIMDHVDINVINSDTGPIDISQMCGNCSNGVCNCFINDLDINIINSKVPDGVKVFQKCGNCFSFSEDQPCESGKVVQIDCTTLKPIDPTIPIPNAGCHTSYSRAYLSGSKNSGNKKLFIIIGISLVIIFLIIYLFKRR